MKRMIDGRRRGGGGAQSKQDLSVPNVARMNGVVAPCVLAAMRITDKILTKAGIRHVLVGGLAVGAYGYPRATDDADFLVDDTAIVRRHGVSSMRPEIPIDVRGVSVDTIWANFPEEYGAIASSPVGGSGIRVAPIAVIVAMKLRARRRRDDGDVVELLVRGVDENAVRTALSKFDVGLVGRFDQLAEQAVHEREERR
jgi:hypothetical protein